jgi:hypothetical protein
MDWTVALRQEGRGWMASPEHDQVMMSMTGEAEAGSAGEQPAEE